MSWSQPGFASAASGIRTMQRHAFNKLEVQSPSVTMRSREWWDTWHDRLGRQCNWQNPILGPALVESTDPATGEVYEETQHSRRRGDLLITLDAKQYLIDVTIVRATPATNLSKETA